MEQREAQPKVVEIVSGRKTYGRGKSAILGLAAVSLTVLAGEYVAIMGASGSGKSTLLNVLGTLDRLDEGDYRLDGVEVGTLDDPALSLLRCRKIGFVFQSFQLLPLYSAVENVELPMRYSGIPARERRARAEAALRRVGLGERLTHLPNQLSGGQQQRVSIARALVNQPRVLLADEPTGALDSASTREILSLLDALNGDGVTVVMVTHDRDVAARTARTVHMQDARIVADGPSAASGHV